MEKTCLECGDVIKGRVDKKFCSDQCRNTYHNKENFELTKYVSEVNRILKKNRRIMLELNPHGKTRIDKDKMIAKGFDFNFFTNVYVTKTGNTYYFCYEHGYLPLENNQYALVVRQDYMNS